MLWLGERKRHGERKDSGSILEGTGMNTESRAGAFLLPPGGDLLQPIEQFSKVVGKET